MKFHIEYSDPKGEAWYLDSGYKRLSREYTLEIAAACRSFATWIKNTPGKAQDTLGVDGEPAKRYGVKFDYKADDMPGGMEDLYSAKVENEGWTYEQVVDMQEAGLAMLGRLLQGARIEIAAGQRT